jgi:triosephosphate isomerase
MVALLGISLKMYMSAAQTRAWVSAIRDVARSDVAAAAEVFVLPSFPLIESTSRTLSGSGILFGAQDVAASEAGAQTGEVSAAVLRELGCAYAEVGHAERRALFGEGDDVVAAKAANAAQHGLIPIVCVGEPAGWEPAGAAAHCVRQLKAALTGCADSPVIVAYEPLWAIGTDRPAPVPYVRAVSEALRPYLQTHRGGAQLLYGGSAGPGLFTELAGSVDGLFLGRFAHNPVNVAAVLDDIRRAAPSPKPQTVPGVQALNAGPS